VGTGKVAEVLEAIWDNNMNSLVIISILTFLADAVSVARKVAGLLDDMSANISSSYQNLIRDKALLHLASLIQGMGPQGLLMRVNLGHHQYEKVPLWRVAFELVKVVPVESVDGRGVEELVGLVTSLQGEVMSSDEIEWLENQCTQVLRGPDMLQAWADLCLSSATRALQLPNLGKSKTKNQISSSPPGN